MNIELPDINLTIDENENVTQRLDPQSAAAMGTAKSDIESELFSKAYPVNNEQANPETEFIWWARDLEMYIPYMRGYNDTSSDGASDGGFKIFMFDQNNNDDVGARFWEAMLSSGDLHTPDSYRKENVHGKKVLKHFIKGGNNVFIPQMIDGEQTSIEGTSQAGSRMILSHACEDGYGADPKGTWHIMPNNFFEPVVYDYENSVYSSVTGYSPGQADNTNYGFGRNLGFAQYQWNNPHIIFQESSGEELITSTAGNKYRSDNLLIHLPEDVDNVSFNHMISRNLSSFNPHSWDTTGGGAHNPQTWRNTVTPYVRGLLNGGMTNDYDTNYHVNGGLFHGLVNLENYGSRGSDQGMNDTTYNGGYGRTNNDFNYYFDMDTAFDTDIESFNQTASQSGQSYYIIAVQVTHAAAELNTDDTTNSAWYAVRIDKNVVYKFLNDKDAMYMIGHCIWHGSNRQTFPNLNRLRPGIYNSKKELIESFSLGGGTNTPFERCNPPRGAGEFHMDIMGRGDESGKWGGDDKYYPRGKLKEMVIVFRKPNPTKSNENNLSYPGSYDSIQAEQQNNYPSDIQQYVNMSSTIDQLKLDYDKEKNFGLFNYNRPYPLDTFSYTPVPLTVSVDEDVNTLNQVYWDRDSIENVRAGAPGKVGLAFDVLTSADGGGTSISPDNFTPVQYAVDGNTPLYHFVNNNRIGYKYAIIDWGESEYSEEEAINQLENLTLQDAGTQAAMASGIFKFVDRLKLASDGSNEFNILTTSIIEPGIKNMWSIIFNYHLREDNKIQPLKWYLCSSRFFLGFKDYFIEDFSVIGGPGFDVLPWPRTTPVISGLSKTSKYFRSLDDINDADQFLPTEVIDQSRISKAMANEELGNFLGTSDIGQMRVYKRPLKIQDQLDVPLINVGGPKFWNNYDFYKPDNIGYPQLSGSYPQESIATSIFINDTESNLLKDCLVEINPGEATNNLHRDSSGNGNKGILIGDYSLSKDDVDTPLTREGVMKLPQIGTEDRAF
tara:strand:+ start:812 stop:3814 length:3003 start_codon:yes stop_codon:yes gene_type:complete